MIDPISIGIAFKVAQSAVSNIKQAIQLGKDVSGLVGEFSRFFENADHIHRANSQVKQMSLLGISNAKIGKMALETAMHSDHLRKQEKELKEVLIYSGNGHIWEDMIKERTRLFKARAEEERLMQEKKRKQKEDLANFLIYTIGVIGGLAILFFVSWLGVLLIVKHEEQKEYEHKLLKRQEQRYHSQIISVDKLTGTSIETVPKG
jgi:hypothetical protein